MRRRTGGPSVLANQPQQARRRNCRSGPSEVDAFALTDNAGFCELAVGVKVKTTAAQDADIDGIGARERNVSRGELGFERRSEESAFTAF